MTVVATALLIITTKNITSKNMFSYDIVAELAAFCGSHKKECVMILL